MPTGPERIALICLRWTTEIHGTLCVDVRACVNKALAHAVGVQDADVALRGRPARRGSAMAATFAVTLQPAFCALSNELCRNGSLNLQHTFRSSAFHHQLSTQLGVRAGDVHVSGTGWLAHGKVMHAVGFLAPSIAVHMPDSPLSDYTRVAGAHAHARSREQVHAALRTAGSDTGGAHDFKELTMIVAAFAVLMFVVIRTRWLWHTPGPISALERNGRSSLSTQRYRSAVDRRYRDCMLDQDEDDICV